jgi:hypothetical protein
MNITVEPTNDTDINYINIVVMNILTSGHCIFLAVFWVYFEYLNKNIYGVFHKLQWFCVFTKHDNLEQKQVDCLRKPRNFDWVQ